MIGNDMFTLEELRKIINVSERKNQPNFAFSIKMFLINVLPVIITPFLAVPILWLIVGRNSNILKYSQFTDSKAPGFWI
jgi:hypothetical protein